MTIPQFLSKHRLTLLTAVTVIACAGVACFLLLPSGNNPDERLATPTPLLLEMLKPGKPLFLSPEFLPCLPAGSRDLAPQPELSAKASRNISEFLKLQRSRHFAAVLIAPDAAYHPLVESLLASPLWVLSDVTPWGYLFSPAGSTAWRLPTDGECAERWPVPSDRAEWLLRTASCLAAIGRNREAEELLRQAETTRLLPSRISATRASIAASRGDWETALQLSRKALRQDRSNRAAREILVRSLIECGRGDEALDQARELTALPSPDETSLFLLARAAHAAGSPEEEISALKRLLDLQRQRSAPTGATQAYLGQACAKSGRRGEALRAFAEVLTAPEITEEQRGAIREVMDHLAVTPSTMTRRSDAPPSPVNR